MSQFVTNQFSDALSEEFTRLIEAYMPDVFPALSLYVIHKGDTVLEGTWGWINPTVQKYPVDPTTLFDLASVTKLFVETSFLSLVSEGKIRLEDKLVDVVKEFGKINPRTIDGGQDPHSKHPLEIAPDMVGKFANPTEVTFYHLLTHTSGLPPWRDVYNAAGSIPKPPTQIDFNSRQERWAKALQALVSYPFVGLPGDAVRYSDIGLMVLGEAIARLHGKPLDLAIADRVLIPLQLESVTYNPVRNGYKLHQTVPTEADSAWRKRRAWGEVHDENACGVGGIAGHAGLFATAQDVARFGEAWLRCDERLSIAPELMQQAVTEQVQGQYRLGLGWMLKAADDSSAGDRFSMRSFGHTGFTGTSLWVDPERELVAVVLTNRVYGGREGEGIHAFRRAIHDLIARGVDER